MKTRIFTLLLFFNLHLSAQDFTQSPFQSLSIFGMAVADLNGDTYPDVVGRNNTGLLLNLNDGGPDIAFTTSYPDVSFDPLGTPGIADMDGDGDIDLIYAADNSTTFYYLENGGSANFTETVLSVGGTTELKIADLDGDNDLDIIGIGFSPLKLDIYINDGNQSFTTVNLLTPMEDLVDFEVADLDGDGDVDIALGVDEFSGNQLVVYENDGANNFSEVVLASSEFSNLMALKIEDINNDGNLDIVAINRFNATVWVNGAGLTFSRNELFSYDFTQGSGLYRSLAIGDYDGNGILDVVAGDNSDDITWNKNLTIVPSYSYERRVVGGVAPAFRIVNGDFDNDGDVDLVVSNGEFWWYENEVEQVVISTVNFSNHAVEIYPNPFQDFIQLENLNSNSYELEVSNPAGQIVYRERIVNPTIHLSNLQSGTYFLTLIDQTNGERQTVTLLKVVD